MLRYAIDRVHINCSYFNETYMSLILPANIQDKIKHLEQ